MHTFRLSFPWILFLPFFIMTPSHVLKSTAYKPICRFDRKKPGRVGIAMHRGTVLMDENK